MDGIRFDEVLLFTADQQGARSVSVMCRYLRVERTGGVAGAPPVLSVGAEPVVELRDGGGEGGGGGGGGGGSGADITIASQARAATTRVGEEEVLAEYLVPFGSMASPLVAASLAVLGQHEGAESENPARVMVRVGGTPGKANGSIVATIRSFIGAETPLSTQGAPFARPTDFTVPVKVTALTPSGRMSIRGFVLLLKAA
jgi:hypothetical protein